MEEARRQARTARDIQHALAALALLDARAAGRNKPSHPEYLPQIVKHFAEAFGFHPSTISASARMMRRLLVEAPYLEDRIRRGELGYVAALKEYWLWRQVHLFDDRYKVRVVI